MLLYDEWLVENNDENLPNKNISRIDEDDIQVDFFEREGSEVHMVLIKK